MGKSMWIVAYGLLATGAIGQTVGGDFLGELSPWANLGAVGVLGYLVKLLLAEIRDQRKDAKEVSEKHAAALSAVGETMREITKTCATTQLRMMNNKSDGGAS